MARRRRDFSRALRRHHPLPNDVAVDAAGNAYVADTDNHRVQKFAADPVPATRRSLGRIKADYR